MVTQMHTNSNNILTSISPMQVWRRSTNLVQPKAFLHGMPMLDKEKHVYQPGTLREVIEFMCTISHKLKG